MDTEWYSNLEDGVCEECGAEFKWDYYNPADCPDLCRQCAREMVVAPSWDAGIELIRGRA